MHNWYFAVVPPLMVWAGIWWYLHRTNVKLAEAQELLEEHRTNAS